LHALIGLYVVKDNRRPQATLAWMLLFLGLPGIGLVIYALFGRDRKAFSRERELARQNLQANAAPLLEPMRARQDAEIDRIEAESPVRRRLMQLVRRNSHSLLTTGNLVAIQQDASTHYPSLVSDLQNTRRSIHLQFYIWRDDPFTQELNAILVERAKSGVEVRRRASAFCSSVSTFSTRVFIRSAAFTAKSALAASNQEACGFPASFRPKTTRQGSDGWVSAGMA
jgi:cardiolipin synthase